MQTTNRINSFQNISNVEEPTPRARNAFLYSSISHLRSLYGHLISCFGEIEKIYGA